MSTVVWRQNRFAAVFYLLGTVAAATMTPSQAFAASTWTQSTAAAPWTGRFVQAVEVYQGRIWLLGGHDGNDRSDVWYTTNGVNWTQATATAPWSGRHGHTALAYDGRLWVTAGSSFGSDVWYSTNGINWTQATAAAGWAGRYMHAHLAFAGRMWVAGGYPVNNDVWSSTNGTNWTQATASAGWAARRAMAHMVFNGRMWIMGGSSDTNDVWFSTNGVNWTEATSAAAWGPRFYPTSALLDGRMWVIGGGSNDVWSSTNGVNWTQDTVAAPWAGRTYQSSVAFDSRIWVMAGLGIFNDVWYATPCASPSVTAHPGNQTVCTGQSATFNVTANGDAPLAYQWRKNGATIGGATAASYAINPVTPADAGSYDVVVTNACGIAMSNAAALTVNMSPSITTHPSNQTIINCSPATFSVAASGTAPLTYQWRRNGSNLSDGGHVAGATTNVLTINPVGTADEGNYDCVVTNICGAATSNTATLTLVFGDRSDCDTNGIPDECQPGGGTRQWIGATGGSFSTASNWNPTGAPGVLNAAVLSYASSSDNHCVLADPGETEVCTVSVSATGGGRQILEIGDGSVLRAISGTTIASGGDINLQGGELAGGTVVNSSNSVSGFGIVSANVVNQGVIEGVPGAGGLILAMTGGSLDNQAPGTLRANIGSLVLVQTDSVTQSGELEIRSGSNMVFSGPLANSAGGLIEMWGGTIGTGGLTNDSLADIFGFGTIDGTSTNFGVITVIADTQIVGDLDNTGTIFIQNGVMTVTGNLSGSGTIIGGFGGRDGTADDAGMLIRGDFDLSVCDWHQIDLTNSVIQMTGDSTDEQTFEAPAVDRSSRLIALPDASLFSIGTLRIGPTATTVRLVDRHRNSPTARHAGPEAVYVKHLVLDPGVTLDVAGLHLYYETVSPADPFGADSAVTVIDTVGGGGLIAIQNAPRRQ